MSARVTPAWSDLLGTMARDAVSRLSRRQLVSAAFFGLLAILGIGFLIATGSASPEVSASATLPVAVPALSDSTSAPLGAAEPDWTSLIVDMVGKLVPTVGLIYGSLFVARRYLGRGALRREPEVRIVETLPLGQHRSLHLVKVGGRQLLIGATPSQINLLADIGAQDGDAAAAPPLEDPSVSFGDRLRALRQAPRD